MAISSPEALSKFNNSPLNVYSNVLIVRIRKYLSANYGAMSANNFKTNVDNNLDVNGAITDQGRTKIKEMYLEILQKEFRRTYKTAYAVRLTFIDFQLF